MAESVRLGHDSPVSRDAPYREFARSNRLVDAPHGTGAAPLIGCLRQFDSAHFGNKQAEDSDIEHGRSLKIE